MASLLQIFERTLATVYTHDMAPGGGNGHDGGSSEVCLDVAEAMGKSMAELLRGEK